MVGSGSYLIAHNSIDCGWADGATGINVFARAFAPEASAIVVDNYVTMSAPEGTVFGASSAGIQIRGFDSGQFSAKQQNSRTRQSCAGGQQ